MPTVIGHHDVKDKDHWLASSKREEFFGPLGVTNIRTFVDPTNPTRVAVLMDVADMDALKAAMDTPGAGEAMALDGVAPETLVMLCRGVVHLQTKQRDKGPTRSVRLKRVLMVWDTPESDLAGHRQATLPHA